MLCVVYGLTDMQPLRHIVCCIKLLQIYNKKAPLSRGKGKIFNIFILPLQFISVSGANGANEPNGVNGANETHEMHEMHETHAAHVFDVPNERRSFEKRHKRQKGQKRGRVSMDSVIARALARGNLLVVSIHPRLTDAHVAYAPRHDALLIPIIPFVSLVSLVPLVSFSFS